MAKTGGINDVIQAFVEEKTAPHTNKGGTVYHTFNNRRYRVLYSYGVHFPLAYNFPRGDPVDRRGVFILNGDGWGPTTSAHQSAVRNALIGKRFYTVSVGALRQAGVDIADCRIVDAVEERSVWAGGIVEEDIPENAHVEHGPDGEVRHWHLAATLVLAYRYRTWDHETRQDLIGPEEHFLCGMDERTYFVSRLPHRVRGVPGALAALKPRRVRQWEKEHGTKALRQGEWFFLPCLLGKEARRIYAGMWKRAGKIFMGRRTPAGWPLPHEPGGNPHIATRGMSRKGKLLVSGSVRHPEHRTLRLSRAEEPVIFEALRNTAVASWSASKVD